MQRRFLIFFVILLFSPLLVFADSINLDCPSEVTSNSTFECKITGTVTKAISDVEFNIVAPKEITLVSFKNGENWQGTVESDMVVAFYGEKIISGTFNIGTVKLKNSASSDFVIKLDKITFYNDVEINTLTSISKTITVKKSNNNSVTNKDNTSVAEDKNIVTNDETKEENVVNNDETSDVLIDNGPVVVDKKEKKNYSAIFMIIIGVLVILNVILYVYRKYKKDDGGV